MKLVAKYWGFVLLVVAAGLWFSRSVGPGILIALSAATTAYFLFQAPVWCGAGNRDGTLCRRNATGILLGCSLRQHKWQKLRMALFPRLWSRLNRAFWANPGTGLSTIGAVLGIVSTFLAIVTAIIGLQNPAGKA